MSKAVVIYWSGTGNTKAMADAIAAGAGVEAVEVGAAPSLADVDAVAFGCPAMGAEELEESEFEPYFAGVEGELKGKKVLIFGSYGWGDGEWMRSWAERVSADGGVLLEAEGYMVNGEPGDAELDTCKELGKKLAE